MKLKVEQEVDLREYITHQLANRFKSFGDGRESKTNFFG